MHRSPPPNRQVLQAELASLSELLTRVVNAARYQPGWPIEAVAAGLAALEEEMSFRSAASRAPSETVSANIVASENLAAREAATAAALSIAEEAVARLAPSAAPVTELRLSRGFETGWGDHELAMVVRALERPSFDPQLTSLLVARQRLDDAGVVDLCRMLDKHMSVLGVSIDQFGLWRQTEDDGPIGARLGVMGSALLVGDPRAVISLTLGTQEIRGGAPLASLLAMLPRLERLSLSSCHFLHALPDEIAALAPTLRELLLERCVRLSVLPDAICRLTALRTLDCAGCECLRALPSELGSLGRLEQLTVSQSERDLEDAAAAALQADDGGPNRRRTMRAVAEGPGITMLPASLCTLASLRHLTLGLPGLRSLPDDFGALATLRTLCLNGRSGLEALPASAARMRQLEYLELPSCPGTASLPDNLLTQVPRLASLPAALPAPTALPAPLRSSTRAASPFTPRTLPSPKHGDSPLPNMATLGGGSRVRRWTRWPPSTCTGAPASSRSPSRSPAGRLVCRACASACSHAELTPSSR